MRWRRKSKRFVLVCRGCGTTGAGNDRLCNSCRYIRRRDAEEGRGWHIG